MENGNMEMLISRIRDEEQDLQKTTLAALQNLVKDSQGSEGEKIQSILDYKDKIRKSVDWTEGENKQVLFDLLSVIYVLDDSHQYVKKLVKCIVVSRLLLNKSNIYCRFHRSD